MRMTWHDLLFAHWPVEPESINRLLPGIECDTFEGSAWVGVVPFRMSNVAPRFVPSIPGLSAFPELNVRTYVCLDGKPGVWFFSLDSPNQIANRIARRFFHLPYMDASISLSSQNGTIAYTSNRYHRNEPEANLEIIYEPSGDTFRAEPGSLEYWLTARYCLYTADKNGKTLRGEIDHPPWKLIPATAEIRSNTMLDWLKIKPIQSAPHLLMAKDISVQAWLNQEV